jgi:cyclophilin family peptidyl-prolyl cis-trans isomerase
MPRRVRFLRRIPSFFLIGAIVVAGCGSPPDRFPPPPGNPEAAAPDSFQVTFETTKGEFIVEAYRAWSPLAADRFYDLVSREVYDSVPIFRVVPNFVVQFGLTGNEDLDSAWDARGINDEKVLEPNTPGRVAFARDGPRTRSSQLFIDLKSNSPRLDTISRDSVTGYPPFGEVVKGMDVVDSFNSQFGNAPAELQDSISIRGLIWLNSRFPGLDYIVKCRLSN